MILQACGSEQPDATHVPDAAGARSGNAGSNASGNTSSSGSAGAGAAGSSGAPNGTSGTSNAGSVGAGAAGSSGAPNGTSGTSNAGSAGAGAASGGGTAGEAGAAGSSDTAGDGGQGGADCTCLKTGQWAVDNESPCFFTVNDVTTAISTIDPGGSVQCPSDPSAAPTAPWSQDTLTLDCTGHYKLCFTLKAGDPLHPAASDCTVVKVCTEADYTVALATQAFPPLPGWLADPSASACVAALSQTGGYGALSVEGTTPTCGVLPERVFSTVTYCPLSCNEPNPPAACATCVAGGDGKF
jgi:hypothetical protein